MNARNLIPATVALALALGTSACAVEPQAGDDDGEESVGTQSQAATVTPAGYYNWWIPAYNYYGYSFLLYGRDLNGRTLNGSDLTGRGLLGVSLKNVRVKNKVKDATLDATTFKASNVSGKDFVGAYFDAVLDDGSILPIRIDAMTQDSSPLMKDVYRYTVSYETQSAWKPLCGVDAAGAPVKATPLSGRWDYRQGVEGGGARIADPQAVTFACDGYALAKCVDLGYKPWKSIAGSTTALADIHQACTRAMRADYCGDGSSYTDDGTLIDLTDRFLIHLPSPGWPFEAEWDTGGARCATRLRVPTRGTPSCWNDLQQQGCGNPWNFLRGTLLGTQIGPESATPPSP